MRSKSLAILLAACASSTSLLHADVIDTTWLGGDGSWHNSAGWSGGVVPNNSGSTTFNSTIPTGSLLLTSSGVTIDSLGLDADATLRISRSLAINGNARIDGYLRSFNLLTIAGALTGS